VDALARVILGALNEAAMLIAHAEDEGAARRDVTEVVDTLLDGIRPRAASTDRPMVNA
jgi:hypothetical protein